MQLLLVVRAPLNTFGPSSAAAFGEETDATRHMDNAAMRQEQQRIIEGCVIFLTVNKRNYMCLLSEQDRGLEALSQALRRQKQMGKAIGDEVDYQTG